MRHLIAIILLVAAPLASAVEPVVSLDYSHTLRIPNRHIRISVDPKGMLEVTTESRDKEKAIRLVQLSGEKFQNLRRDLDEIDWKKVSADKTKGLDGTTIRILYGKQAASLWSPDYDSQKRGLSRIQKTIESLFDLSGLDRTGMPK